MVSQLSHWCQFLEAVHEWPEFLLHNDVTAYLDCCFIVSSEVAFALDLDLEQRISNLGLVTSFTFYPHVDSAR